MPGCISQLNTTRKYYTFYCTVAVAGVESVLILYVAKSAGAESADVKSAGAKSAVAKSSVAKSAGAKSSVAKSVGAKINGMGRGE